jgi:hypothetical protein
LKLRREVRALLTLGCADGREADGPNGKAVKDKLQAAKKSADAARTEGLRKAKEKAKADRAKKNADRKARAALFKAAVAKAKKANKPPPPPPEAEDSDSDEDPAAKAPAELQPNDELFNWVSPYSWEGPPPRPPPTAADVDDANDQLLALRWQTQVRRAPLPPSRRDHFPSRGDQVQTRVVSPSPPPVPPTPPRLSSCTLSLTIVPRRRSRGPRTTKS